MRHKKNWTCQECDLKTSGYFVYQHQQKHIRQDKVYFWHQVFIQKRNVLVEKFNGNQHKDIYVSHVIENEAEQLFMKEILRIIKEKNKKDNHLKRLAGRRMNPL